MNIFLHEFKQKTKSIAIWSISIGLMVLIFMSVFPSFADNAEILQSTLDSFPEEFLMAFGMNGIDMSSVVGFYGMCILFCMLVISIQAANYGFSMVSVEERDLTADFLLTKPISRVKILTSKLFAAIAALAITNLVTWICTYLSITVFQGDRTTDFQILNLMLFSITFMQLFFLSVGMAVSQMVKKIRTVVPYSMGLVFGMYMLNAFGGMLGEDSFEIISPFTHFEPNGIISRGGYDWPMPMISFVVIILGIALTYFLYPRRDIHSV